MHDLYHLLPMFFLLIAAGAFAGLIAGLLGVGGGIILVPAFYYIFATLGHDSPQLMQVCLGTSLATIIITSLRSLKAHHQKGAVAWDILKGWALPIMTGAVSGFLLASRLKSSTLQLVFGVLVLVAGLYMALGRSEWRLGTAMPTGTKKWGFGGLLGFLSVLMGIGGGTFGVPLMTLYNMPIHRAVATASGFGLLIALPSALGFLWMPITAPPPYSIGAVNLPAFAIIITMTLIVTPYGARLAHSTNPKPLKKFFALFLIIVALNMLRKAAGW